MNTTKIQYILCTQDFTFTVFRTDINHWQFRVISSSGAVYGECRHYNTLVAAERAGREWIQQAI
jgi:hypothetical protein